MARIGVVSDLHLEVDEFSMPETDCDIMVLAGDIAEGVDGVRWAKQVFDIPVVYVLGNHEYFGFDMSLHERAKSEADGSNVIVLEREACEIDGIEFLGATLWSDFDVYGSWDKDISVAHVEKISAEFKRINCGEDRLRAERLVEENALAREWLEDRLSQNKTGRRVVVTHHAPSIRSIETWRYGEAKSRFYASRMDDLMSSYEIDCWFHGHTHYNVDYEHCGCRVVSNPKGYNRSTYDESGQSFDPLKVIEL